MLTQQPDSPNNNRNRTMNPLSQMFQNIFSDNSNIMLAAIISLLLVILFVLLLHLYAKWFLAQAQAQAHARRRRRRLRRATVTVSDVLGPARFHHFHSFNIEDSPISSINTKGLDSAIIAAIPIFIYAASETEKGDDVYDEKKNKVELEHELECVICLSAFEDGEMGRCLPKCGHGFHVECIDMWFKTHSNCPICRAPIVVGGIIDIIESNDSQLGSVDGLDHDHDHIHVHVHDGDDDDSSALVEIVVDDVITQTTSSEIRERDQSGNDNGVMSGDSVSETSSNFMPGFSLKRMLSKVFPSSNNVNE